MNLSIHHRFKCFLIPFAILLFHLPYEGLSQEIPERDSLIIVRNIKFSGNKTTKDHIVSRELMIAEGDTLTAGSFNALLEKSRENLLNTSLFNFVTTDLHTSAGTYMVTDISFNFVERWYIWPWPIIEFADRNFNTWWTENRDLSRMSYGVELRWGNFRGRKEQLNLTARFGYSELYGFDYTIPYLNKKENLGLGIGAAYGRSHEAPVVNEDDRLVYYDGEDEYVQKNVSSYISLIYRREIYNTHTFRIEYNYWDFADTLNQINPEFTPGGVNELQYFSLAYQFKSDHRDNKPYPLNGYYFDVAAARHGFGLLENGGMDVFYILTTFRQYFKLAQRWYLSSGLNARFSNESSQPFYLNRAIGYGRDIVRGYEYYVVNGHNFGIMKNNIKFALVPRRDFDLSFIRSEKFSRVHYAFYLNAFFDLGFADQIYPIQSFNNQLENTLLIGYGVGLDFVTYYDLVIRMEYSFNRMNEYGFFLHFRAPI